MVLPAIGGTAERCRRTKRVSSYKSKRRWWNRASPSFENVPPPHSFLLGPHSFLKRVAFYQGNNDFKDNEQYLGFSVLCLWGYMLSSPFDAGHILVSVVILTPNATLHTGFSHKIRNRGSGKGSMYFQYTLRFRLDQPKTHSGEKWKGNMFW